MPTLQHLLMSCKLPDSDQDACQDDTFSIDTTHEEPTNSNAASVLPGVTSDNEHQHPSSDSYTIEPPTPLNEGPQEQRQGPTSHMDFGLKGIEDSFCNQHQSTSSDTQNTSSGALASFSSTAADSQATSPPVQKVRDRAPLEPSPSPPMLLRSRIKLSATTMEAIKRVDSMSPEGIASTLPPSSVKKYQRNFDTSNDSDHALSPFHHSSPHENACRRGDSSSFQAPTAVAMAPDHPDAQPVMECDFGLNFDMGGDVGQPNQEQEQRSPDGKAQWAALHGMQEGVDNDGNLNFSLDSPLPLSRNAALHEKYARSSSSSDATAPSQQTPDRDHVREEQQQEQRDLNATAGHHHHHHQQQQQQMEEQGEVVEQDEGQRLFEDGVTLEESVTDSVQQSQWSEKHDEQCGQEHEETVGDGALPNIATAEYQSLPSFVQAQVKFGLFPCFRFLLRRGAGRICGAAGLCVCGCGCI